MKGVCKKVGGLKKKGDLGDCSPEKDSKVKASATVGGSAFQRMIVLG